MDDGSIASGTNPGVTRRDPDEVDDLARTLQWQQAIFEGSRDAIFITDEDSRLIAVNRAACDLTGYAREELLQLRILDLHDDVDLDAFRRYHEIIMGGQGALSEAELRRKDGTKVATEFSNSRIVIGGRRYMHTTARDVTERYRVEEALRATNAAMEALVKASPLAIIAMTPDTTVTLWNPAAECLFGWTAAEVLGKPLPIVPPEENEAFVALLKEHAEGRTQEGRELVRRHKDGSLVDVSLWTAHLRDASGRVAATLGVMADISERKRGERELKNQLGFLQGLADAMPFPVFVKDTTGRFRRTNSAFDAFSGTPRTAIVGKTVFEVTSPDLAEIFAESDKKLLHEGGSDTYEGPFLAADGSPHNVIIRKAAYREPDGRIGGVVGVIVDITERERAEEAQRQLEGQLLQAQKMQAIGSLAGGVAHDFNNLLQAMIGQVELVRSAPGDPARVAASVAELEQQIRRGAALARQLLLFSRREATKPEALDLNGVIEGARHLLGRLVRDDITFKVELANEPLPVFADRGKLDQVLMNLVVNASDAMPEGGQLTIRSGVAEGERVWLSVEDTGDGIPPAIRERIFEPFFTTKGDQGSGLGLSVVHGIVTQHGGAIRIADREGGGTIFHIELPKAQPAAGRAIPEPRAGEGDLPLGAGERILVVEDEDAARGALVDLLTMLGYLVTGVASSEDAGRLPVEPVYDLLLTDLLLPGASGADLVRGLQARWRRLKVILMSGYAEDEAVRRGVGGGWVRFLQKPFDMKTLAQEVAAVLHEEPQAAAFPVSPSS